MKAVRIEHATLGCKTITYVDHDDNPPMLRLTQKISLLGLGDKEPQRIILETPRIIREVIAALQTRLDEIEAQALGMVDLEARG